MSTLFSKIPEAKTNAKEKTIGIGPLAVEDIRRQIERLSDSGIGMLITDHNVRETLSTCDRAYIVKDGKIIEEGSPQEIAGSERARALYLGDRFRLDDEKVT